MKHILMLKKKLFKLLLEWFTLRKQTPLIKHSKLGIVLYVYVIEMHKRGISLQAAE